MHRLVVLDLERWGEHAHCWQRCLSDVHRSMNVQTSCHLTKYYFSDRTARFIKPCFELFFVVTGSAQCSVFGTFLFRCIHLQGVIIFEQLKWERHNLKLDCCWPYLHFVNLEVILPANTKCRIYWTKKKKRWGMTTFHNICCHYESFSLSYAGILGSLSHTGMLGLTGT